MGVGPTCPTGDGWGDAYGLATWADSRERTFTNAN